MSVRAYPFGCNGRLSISQSATLACGCATAGSSQCSPEVLVSIWWVIAFVATLCWVFQLTRERIREGRTLGQAILPGVVVASVYGLIVVAAVVESAHIFRDDTAVVLFVVAAFAVLAFALVVVRYERRITQRLRSGPVPPNRRSTKHRR
jgi:hypothetical protein